MKVQVIKSSKASYWYADKIGEIFEVEGFDSGSHVVKAPAPYDKGYYIDICDTKEVTKNMKDFIIRVDHIDPKKRHSIICKILTHMKELGYTTVDRYPNEGDNTEHVGYITTQVLHSEGWGMCYVTGGLCHNGGCTCCDRRWDMVMAEDFLKFTEADVVNEKVVSCKIDLSWLKGQAREVISEAIQKKLFEADARWNNGNTTACDMDGAYLLIIGGTIFYINEKDKFDGKRDGNRVPKETVLKIPEVSVNNALKGDFWTYSVYPKKEEAPKPEGYKVSLAAYTGKTREVVSKAVQKEAFKKGYRWYFPGQSVQFVDMAHLYFDTKNCTVCYDSLKDNSYFIKQDFKEVSVDEILSGILPSVK